MKNDNSRPKSRTGLLTTVLLALGVSAQCADSVTLKEAYQDHFLIGTAINRAVATGTASLIIRTGDL